MDAISPIEVDPFEVIKEHERLLEEARGLLNNEKIERQFKKELRRSSEEGEEVALGKEVTDAVYYENVKI